MLQIYAHLSRFLCLLVAVAAGSGCAESNPKTLWVGYGPTYGTLALVDEAPPPF